MEWYERLNQEFACAHERSTPVRFIKSNGVVCVRVQCQQCGENLGEKRKADYCVDKLPMWDHELKQERIENYRRRQIELRDQAESQRQAAIVEQSQEWWEKYNAYLRSTQWHKMRQLVLDRDGNLCQACLTNKATHVHHVSYDLYNRLGKSAAFELVAICRLCHEQIHPHMSDAQDKLTLYSPFLNGGTNGKHR